MRAVQRVLRSVAFYTATLTYLSGVAVAFGVAAGWLRFDVGLILFAACAILVVLVATHRSVEVVHGLVNSQHDAMVERIDELLDALTAAGVSIPHDRAGVDRDRKSR